jgi:hypothetical protein
MQLHCRFDPQAALACDPSPMLAELLRHRISEAQLLANHISVVPSCHFSEASIGKALVGCLVGSRFQSGWAGLKSRQLHVNRIWRKKLGPRLKMADGRVR